MVKLFNWNYKYSVNIDMLDNQHKKIIDIINKLHNAIIDKKSHLILNEIFDELIDYSNTHFNDELKLMEKYFYPLIEEHKECHNNYVKMITKMKNDFNNNKNNIDLEVIDFLINWWFKHIGEEDQKYSQYFNNLGIR